jgi:methionyl aminopeptidase
VSKEDLPRAGQFHPAGSSDKQRRPQLVLQSTDLPTHRRLRDSEMARRPTDVPSLRDRDEVLDLGQAHGDHPSAPPTRVQQPRGLVRSKWHWIAAPPALTIPRVNVEIYGPRETERLRRAGAAAAATLAFVAERLEAGIATADIDVWVREHTKSLGGRPSQLGYEGFPAAVCTSKNHVVCHGIPRRDEVLEPGDILNVDVTTELCGFHGDTSATFVIGEASKEARHVVDVARRCRDAGIAVVRDGVRLGDIGAAIAQLAEREGCSVVRELGGHGIGREMHMAPHVPHFGARGAGPRLRAGMVFTVEPMINLGSREVRVLGDGWTVVTADGSLSAQFEHTVLVTRDGYEILTQSPPAPVRPIQPGT